MKGLLASVGIGLLVLAKSVPAGADEGKPPAPAKAGAEEPEWKVQQRRQVLFSEGQKLLEDGHPKEALEKFGEVYRLRAHPRVRLYIAAAEEQLGHLLKARAIYAQAAIDARDAKLPDVERDAMKALTELTRTVPHIVVRADPPMPFVVVLDSKRVELKDGRVDVDPGQHVVFVSATGRKSYHAEIVVKAEQEKILDAYLPLEVPDPGGTPKPEDTPSPTGGPPAGAILLDILGASAAIAGGTLIGVGYSNSNRAEEAGGGVLLGCGVAALIGGIVWQVLPSNSAPTAVARSSTRRDLLITAAPLPGGAWLGAQAKF